MMEEILPFEMSMNFYILFISGAVRGSILDRITRYIEVTVSLARSALRSRHQQACRYGNLQKPFGAMLKLTVPLSPPVSGVRTGPTTPYRFSTTNAETGRDLETCSIHIPNPRPIFLRSVLILSSSFQVTVFGDTPSRYRAGRFSGRPHGLYSCVLGSYLRWEIGYFESFRCFSQSRRTNA
jgi:hypothetical protein